MEFQCQNWLNLACVNVLRKLLQVDIRVKCFDIVSQVGLAISWQIFDSAAE